MANVIGTQILYLVDGTCDIPEILQKLRISSQYAWVQFVMPT